MDIGLIKRRRTCSVGESLNNFKKLLILLIIPTVLACGRDIAFQKKPAPKCQGSEISCTTVGGFDFFDYTDTIQSVSHQVDILFVVDNSTSMKIEQSNMANRFSNFIESIKNLDWQIGMITTDAKNESGKLRTFVGTNSTILTKMTPNANQVFQNTVQMPDEGYGDERGIYTSILAIQRNEGGWLRPQADFAIVILSDEDERSDGGQTLGFPLESGRDFPTDLTNTVRSKWGSSKKFSVHSIIIQPNDSACLSQQINQGNPDSLARLAYYGNTYAELTSITGGVIGSVCARDYGNQLSQIGNVIVQTISSRQLACVPEGELNYSVSPEMPGLSVEVDGDKVIFSPPLPEGTTVRLQYKCPQLY